MKPAWCLALAAGAFIQLGGQPVTAAPATAAGRPSGVVIAQATAAPAPAPTDAQASDPCGGDTRLLATLNRPTVGYSACAVPTGAVILEEGYQNQARGGAAGYVTTSYPQGFERFGLAQGVELDVIGPNVNRLRAQGSVTSGLSDYGVGFKHELAQRGRFTYALDGLFTPATGTGGSGAGGPTETVNADISYSVSPAIGVGTTLAASSSAGTFVPAVSRSGEPPPQVTGRFGTFVPSVVITAQIPHAYQFYAEVVGQTKLGPGQGGHVFGDFGLQKLLSAYVEVDAEYGQEFTPVSGARFNYIGLGVGLRVR